MKLLQLVGVYPVRPEVPAVGGYEGVGKVHLVGAQVKDLSPGDLVIPSPPSSGTFYFPDDLCFGVSIDILFLYFPILGKLLNPICNTMLHCFFYHRNMDSLIVNSGSFICTGLCFIPDMKW